MKWLLPVCLFFACQQSQKTVTGSGNDPIKHSMDSSKQEKPDTNRALQKAPGLRADQLIVPGESIGKTHLGTDASQLEALLGHPDMSDAAMGKAWLTWKGRSDLQDNITELNIYTTYKDSTMREKTVQQIRTTSPFFSTAGGARVNTSFAAIRRIFPYLKKAAHYTGDKRTIIIYNGKSEGISFETVTSGGQETCTGIIVHLKETDVTAIYLSLHPDMQRN